MQKANILCQAPFKSLRFERAGRVVMCCHNHTDVVGIYPEQCLADLWESEKIRTLRTGLSSAMFPRGCDHCKQEHASGSDARSSALYDRFQAADDQPVILDFKTDDRCNLACIMCSGLSSSSIDTGTAKTASPFHTDAFLEELALWIPKLSEVRFSGGEPFLSDFYRKIWALITRLNSECRIVVQTNGTLLDDNTKTLLRQGNFHINLSIDSFREETYRKIRRGADLKTVLKNATWFRDYCLEKSRFWGMTACAMQANRTEFGEIASKWDEYSARGWFSMVWFPPAQALWTLEHDELRTIQDSLAKPSMDKRTDIQKYNASVLQSLSAMIEPLTELSSCFHHPNPGHLITADLVYRQIEDDNLRQYLHTLFPDGDTRLFNISLFRKILGVGSESQLNELITPMSQEEKLRLFSFFLSREGSSQ